jgi:cell wall-associated NlpC family hydrolase
MRRCSLAVLAACTAGVASLAVLPGAAVAEPRASTITVQRQVDSLHQQAEQAVERYNNARVQLGEVRLRLTQVTHRLEKAQGQLTTLRSTMGRMAAATYKSGGLDASMQLLLSDQPEAFLQQATTLDQLGRRQASSLRKITAARQRLAQDQLAVDQQRAQMAQLQSSLQSEKTAIEARLSEATALLGTLKASDRAQLAAAARAAAALAVAQRASAPRASRQAPRPRPASGTTGGTTRSKPTYRKPTYSGASSGRAATAVRTAYAQLGDPYVWGASGPNAFDCSGLTSYAWRSAGVSLPHSSSAQYSSGRRISRSELRPGDLVFFYSPISHVGIYIGGGRMIDAPYPGRNVKITSIATMPYSGAVRL